MPLQYSMKLSIVIDNGDWQDIPKPAIREYYPTGDEEVETTFRAVRSQMAETTVLDRYYRLRRVIVVQLINQERGEYGMGRHVESEESMDSYQAIIKAPNINELEKIFNQMKKIFIDNNILNYYSRIEVPTSQISQGKTYFVRNCQVLAYITGKLLRDDILG